MQKFRKIPVEVEAQQWFPPGDDRHSAIDCVIHNVPKVQYSLDGKYYYITGSRALSTQWLAVEKTPIEQSESFKGNGFDGMVGFKHGDQKYGRHSLPFATYEVKSGRSEPVDVQSDLYLDYGSAEKWTEHPKGSTYIERPPGRMIAVAPGDWIIKDVDGEFNPCKPDIFAKTYEPVTE